MATKTLFKKGDQVTGFDRYDRDCTIRISRYTVGSCGDKQMHLLRLDGSNALYRTYVHLHDQYPRNVIRKTESPEIEAAFALQMSADLVIVERKHYADCLTRYADASVGYKNAIQRDMDALDSCEPKFFLGYTP